MSDVARSSQARAVKAYRAKLRADGLVRYEVLGRGCDRDVVRKLARRLAEDGENASRLRAEVDALINPGHKSTGEILAALRRSPLVGADVDFTRDRWLPRDIDL